MFSLKFIAAGTEFTTLQKGIPAPYLRRSFTLESRPLSAVATVCGLGFYELFVNGKRITKGLLAPYISNPDDILYYDSYDIAEYLYAGENVIGLQLGNGMLNCPGGQIWDFEKARYRSAPKAAVSLEVDSKLIFEGDGRFRTAPSPIWFDDLRAGEFYDARLEQPGWNCPGFDDSTWSPAIPAETPRGECRICSAEPIVITDEIPPADIRRAAIGKVQVPRSDLPVLELEDFEKVRTGWLYDFGVNAAGLCRLKIKGNSGQKVVLQFGEALDENGDLDLRGMSFLPDGRDHRDIYILKGGEEEIWMPSFTYHGFRYCLAIGLTEEQAVPETLTYCVMNSDLRSKGGFSCSDEVLNRLQQATRVADLANFYYFPTDCPHREKNGWTADAALSAEQMLMNFTPERSYKEWLNNIRKAQREDGALPGIIPTSGWGFEWGNGPAWDAVLAYLPYFTWRLRGDVEIIRENATALVRYLEYLTHKRDSLGLIHIGLGDWCQSAHTGDPTAPLALTDTVLSYDIARKTKAMFHAAGLSEQEAFAGAVAEGFLNASRKYLIDHNTCVAAGDCQTSQAMALYYGIFSDGEKAEAFEHLLDLIAENDGLMDVGVLGGRVLFRVLSDFGHTDLALDMILTERYPSYANWIHDGATSLWEDFHPSGHAPNSLNHHFWGDISAWFIETLAGIVPNPEESGANGFVIRPCFAKRLDNAEGWFELPSGRLSVGWSRVGDAIEAELEVPESANGMFYADRGWQFENGFRVTPAKTGVYRLIPVKQKDTRYIHQV